MLGSSRPEGERETRSKPTYGEDGLGGASRALSHHGECGSEAGGRVSRRKVAGAGRRFAFHIDDQHLCRNVHPLLPEGDSA